MLTQLFRKCKVIDSLETQQGFQTGNTLHGVSNYNEWITCAAHAIWITNTQHSVETFFCAAKFCAAVRIIHKSVKPSSQLWELLSHSLFLPSAAALYQDWLNIKMIKKLKKNP